MNTFTYAESTQSSYPAIGAAELSPKPETAGTGTNRASRDHSSIVANDLTVSDVRSLFSGAPHFSVSTVDGVSQAKAEFPWDSELETRDASDHQRFGHPAFSVATLRRHLTEAGDHGPAVGYDIAVLEIPSMLSAQGNEPGTVGFQYFLQDPIGDALQAGRGFEEAPTEDDDGKNNYDLLHTNPEKLGLRAFNRAAVLERLAKLSELYQESRRSLDSRISPDLFRSLFDELLLPPEPDPVHGDAGSLKIQIKFLTNRLRLKHLWYDFSQVNWRIRLGQIFWSDVADDASHDAGESDDSSVSDHDILLLQLVLACELLVRLDTVADMERKTTRKEIDLTPDDVRNFRSLETRKTRWDLVLARRFLENIELKFTPDPEFLPRKAPQQLSGLLYFAKCIRWPDVDKFEAAITERLQSKKNLLSVPSPIPSIYATPLSSPRSNISSNRNSYFENRSQPGRSSSQISLQLLSPTNLPPNVSASAVTAASVGGWLSRSWLTGLVLPGEPISHFLISTLLENDSEAIRSLGDSATLYGGFVYRDRSWWSKHCIVSKVLACLPGSSECMGWLSAPCIPEGFHEQWVDVVSQHLDTQDSPRINIEDVIKRDSDLVGNQEADAIISPSEFTMPKDPIQKPPASLWFECLILQQTERNVFTSEEDDDSPNHRLHNAYLKFSPLSISAKLGNIKLPLQHNVHFVSAYPCTPPPLNKLQFLRRTEDGAKSDAVPGHPLHVSFEYTMLPATDVLFRSYTPDSESQRILVLDARGDSTLELFSRAWCASKGEHGLVSRVGTTCIACSVREAKGLGIRVVIRVG